jgi:hypothetical protein
MIGNSNIIKVRTISASLASIGVPIPTSFTVETELAAQLYKDEADQIQRNQQATQAMTTAETPKDFVTAWDKAAQVRALAAAKSEGSFKLLTNDVLAVRARNALVAEAPGLEALLVDKFNKIVDEHGLNESAKNLPALGEPFFEPLKMSDKELDAFRAWRVGADALQPIWGVFTAVAGISGRTIGSKTDNAPNILACYVLGDVIEHDPLLTMADMFSSWKNKTESAMRYGNLFPFLIPPVHGVPLKLRTTAEAVELAEAVPFADQR